MSKLISRFVVSVFAVLFAAASPQTQAGGPLSGKLIVVENQTRDHIVTGLFIQSSFNPENGEFDALNGRIVRPNKTERFPVGGNPNNCMYNLRVLLQTGEMLRQQNVNICYGGVRWKIKNAGDQIVRL